jgi:hypothetical protein
MLLFLNIFAGINYDGKGCYLMQKKLIITLVFKKIAKFFAEKWSKSPKIVIITLTQGQYIDKTMYYGSILQNGCRYTFIKSVSMNSKCLYYIFSLH